LNSANLSQIGGCDEFERKTSNFGFLADGEMTTVLMPIHYLIGTALPLFVFLRLQNFSNT